MNSKRLAFLKTILSERLADQGDRELYSFERSAAVALILGGENARDILFIHRSEREGDPWSGHIGLPGGGTELGDQDPRATAIRETIEEVGLNLQQANYLGLLKRMQLHKLGSPIDFGLECHVFHLDQDFNHALELNTSEVDEAFWVSQNELFLGQNLSEETFHFSGISRTLPCIKVRGKIIWGITYMLLSEFQKILAQSGKSEFLPLPPYPYRRS